jgi:superoxide dismutase, Fe-Mn family
MQLLNRRQLLKAAGAGAASFALARLAPLAAAKDSSGGFTLPKLPYAYDALEPYIDAKTMEIHHDKHHAAYVKNLNDALKDHPELLKKNIRDLLIEIKSVPEPIRQTVINNGGGHYNHSHFWHFMGPKAGGEPSGALAKDIDSTFGSFDKFTAKFNEAATKRFGSGWAWLIVGDGGKLSVVSTANQDSPIMVGHTPVLGIDVWEHAYYLKYQNRRPEYIKAWWNVVNWQSVAEHIGEAKKGA